MQEQRDATGIEVIVAIGDYGTHVDGISAAGLVKQEAVGFPEGGEGRQSLRRGWLPGTWRRGILVRRPQRESGLCNQCEYQYSEDRTSPRDVDPERHPTIIGRFERESYPALVSVGRIYPGNGDPT